MNKESNNMFTLSNVHELLSRSQSIGINMDTVMQPGVQVIFYKHETGANFYVAVEESSLEIIVRSKTDKTLLKKKSEGSDRVIIARIEQSTDNLEDYFIIPFIESNDEQYSAWLERIGDRFFVLINSYSRWTSFTAFLDEDNLYDVKEMDPKQQIPLDYFLLIGNLKDSDDLFHCGHLPPKKGIYILPDNNLIPVFTSALYADLFAQELYLKAGIKVQSDLLPCVKCYLSGSYKSIGLDNLKGAILNNQWLIDCYNCSICDNSSGHFYLNDGQYTYALCGCPELGAKPIWIEKRWDNNKKSFNPICGMVPWNRD